MACSPPPDLAARVDPLPPNTPWPALLTTTEIAALDASVGGKRSAAEIIAEADALAARVRALRARAIALQNTTI